MFIFNFQQHRTLIYRYKYQSVILLSVASKSSDQILFVHMLAHRANRGDPDTDQIKPTKRLRRINYLSYRKFFLSRKNIYLYHWTRAYDLSCAGASKYLQFDNNFKNTNNMYIVTV